MFFSRRTILALIASLPLLTLPVEAADKLDMKDVLAPHPLGERILGDEKAPVTIVEYFSMTCTHCGGFHKDTFPKLKADYIDTGKVRMVFREVWFDGIAFQEAALARCSGDKYFAAVDFFFAQQDALFASKDPKATLKTLAKQMGFGEAEFDKCVKDEKTVAALQQVYDDGAKKFGVQSTPSFIINGELTSGNLPYEDFKKILDRHLGK